MSSDFSKCLAPGLRIGAMIVPDRFRDRSINAARAMGWMAQPLMAEIVARLIPAIWRVKSTPNAPRRRDEMRWPIVF